MNILHIYKDYHPVAGGIENHIKTLAEAQAARGHAVSVLVTSRDGRIRTESLNGVRVVFAARQATVSSAPISLGLPGLLARERPDIAHLQFPYPWGELANLIAGRARRTVLTYHSDIVRQKYMRVIYAPLMHQVLKRADALIATSPNYIESSPVLSRWKSKCHVVPLGIDPTRFLNVDERAAQRMRADLLSGAPPDTALLLSVGVLRYYKGLGYLLQALASMPPARLAIVGAGPMEAELKALTQALNLSQRVRFLGAVPDADLPACYAACDVFVFPSSERSEAYGLVQVEAMFAGKPVVATELGTGTTFITQAGVTGLVVPPRQPEPLAAALNRLIAEPALRARLGAAGRERALREFTAEAMVERVERVYEIALHLERPTK